MTSTEIEVVTKDVDAAWHGPNGEPILNPNMPTDVAAYRATLEVAWQLAILNEQIGGVLNTRYPRIRVIVEAGEYPIPVQVVERR
jgi:hypothetical protein